MRTRQLFFVAFLLLTFAGTSSSMCFAHPGHGGHGEFENGLGLVSGLLHPYLGLWDILAMIAVAFLAVRVGGRCLWTVPLALAGSLVLNGIGPAVGVHLPGASWPILISIVLVGGLVAKSRVLCFARGL
jgi:urease accessory protein